MAVTLQRGSSVACRQADLASKPESPVSMGLAPAKSINGQLDKAVQETLNNAKGLSTRAGYALR